MKNSRLVKVGILGLGVVGSELVSCIRRNSSRIQAETGVKLVIEKVFVRDMNKTRTTDTTNITLTTNMYEITHDPEISVICECMGGNGFQQTFDIIRTCLEQKKHVVMSSKKALAIYAEDLLHIASANNVCLKYDATVGGGIPIAKVLEHSFKGDKLKGIYGVFNATSNFIYTKMFREKQSFETALKEAQLLGYAENDPSDDVDGFDSLYKLIILTLFGTGKILKPDWINPESFRHIDISDMNYASELGYAIKPVAAMVVQGRNLGCKVAPFLVPENNIIAQTSDNYNAILLDSESCGALGFYGQGAGAGPTATALFDDLINLLQCNSYTDYTYDNIHCKQVKHLSARFYIRFTVTNEVGILSEITRFLASKLVNIERIIQKNEHKNAIDIVLITSELSSELLEEIQNFYKTLGLTIKSSYPLLVK